MLRGASRFEDGAMLRVLGVLVVFRVLSTDQTHPVSIPGCAQALSARISGIDLQVTIALFQENRT